MRTSPGLPLLLAAAVACETSPPEPPRAAEAPEAEVAATPPAASGDADSVGAGDRLASAQQAGSIVGQVIAPRALGAYPALRAASREAMPGRRAERGAMPNREIPNRLVVSFRAPFQGAQVGDPVEGGQAEALSRRMAAALEPYLRGGEAEIVDAAPTVLSVRLEARDVRTAVRLAAALRKDPALAHVAFERRILVTGRARSAATSPGGSSMVQALVAGGVQVAAADPSYPGKLPQVPGYFAQAWHYNMIDAPQAWSMTTGSANVIVAVIDDGIKSEHPAFKGLLTNDGYTFLPAFEADVNVCGSGEHEYSHVGYGPGGEADTELTWNAEDECYDVAQASGHGTHVAATIGAAPTAAGGTGVNWTVKIRPIRALSNVTGGPLAEQATHTHYDVANAVLYAAGLTPSFPMGKAPPARVPRAHVINMSLGAEPSDADTAYARAITAASRAGSLIVVAAGNEASSQGKAPAYLPEVLSVAAVGPDWQIATYSNIGASVDIAAPGGEVYRYSELASPSGGGVYSAQWNYKDDEPAYGAVHGTSMAAPHVAGVAALVFAAKPTATAAEVRRILLETATDVGASGHDDRYGAGVVNAGRAVARALGRSTTPRTFVRLLDALTGRVVRTDATGAGGTFSLTGVPAGAYHLLAGEEENGDGAIGFAGRRFGASGSAAVPATVTVGSTPALANVLIGAPSEVEPNDTDATANRLFVNGYITGRITPSDDEGVSGAVDRFRVVIPAAGEYTFETSGALGSCGFGLELDTSISVWTPTPAGAAIGTVLGANDDDRTLPWGLFCSRVRLRLEPGTYYVTVRPSSTLKPGMQSLTRGHYRLAVRAGQ